MYLKNDSLFPNLSIELLLYILSFLRNPKYFGRLAQTNKALHGLLNDGNKTRIYWYELYRTISLKHPQKIFSSITDYKELYEEAFKNIKSKLSIKHQKLFGSIFLRDLAGITKLEWNPENDFKAIKNSENHHAIELASLYQVQEFLHYFYDQAHKHIFSKNSVDSKGWTKLHYAVACNIVAEIETKTIDELKCACADGALLFIAAQYGHLEIVKLLLAAGIEVNTTHSAPNLKKAPPLFIAVRNGHSEIVQALLNAGAKFDEALSEGGATPLLIATQKGYPKIVKALLDKGADLNQTGIDGSTPFCIAAENGHNEVLQVFINAGSDVNRPLANGTTPIYLAVSNGHSDAVQIFLKNGVKANQARKNGETLLMVAALRGHYEIVRILLNSGADVDKGCNGITPLFVAIQKGHFEIVKVLLEFGAKVNSIPDHCSHTSTKENQDTHHKILFFLKLWKIKTQENTLLPEKIIKILETPTQSKSFLHLKSTSFFSKNKHSMAFINNLKTITNENENNKKYLIQVLEENKDLIAPEKYKFIYEYLLEYRPEILMKNIDRPEMGSRKR